MDKERFPQSVQKLFFSSAIIFISLVESPETYESEPSTSRVMNIRNKPQAAIPSSCRMTDEPFCLSRLPRYQAVW